MSRVIKFRAWSVEGGQMYDLDPKYTHFNNGDLLDNDDWKVMQFTGLHDRNGVEIYDGDILEYSPPHELSRPRNTTRGVMEWDELRGGWAMFSPLDRFVVVGNRFANPELLEGEKV